MIFEILPKNKNHQQYPYTIMLFYYYTSKLRTKVFVPSHCLSFATHCWISSYDLMVGYLNELIGMRDAWPTETSSIWLSSPFFGQAFNNIPEMVSIYGTLKLYFFFRKMPYIFSQVKTKKS